MPQRPAARAVASRNSTNSQRSIRRGQRITDPSAAHPQQPAARVIRTSRPAVAPTITGDEEVTVKKDDLPPVVLDAVVEKRKPRRKRNTKKQLNSSGSVQSRSFGVPAFHDVPLGSLVPTKSGGGTSATTSDYQKNKSKNQQSGSGIQTGTTPTSSTTTADTKEDIHTHDDNDISKASDRILQGMSPVEIQDALHELHTSLDTSKIAFLQQRRRSKKKQQLKAAVVAVKQVQTLSSSKEEAATDYTSTTTPISQPSAETTADLLSSLQTYEDLDAAVESTATATSTIPSSLPDSVANSTNAFHVACHLLRSSSPPQVQWAARTVAKELQQSQGNWTPPTSPSAPSFLLPVALRCLLDSLTAPQTLAYTWQALDCLLQLTLCVSTERSIHRAILQHDGLCDVAVVDSTPAAPMVDTAPTAIEGAVYCTTSGNGSAQADAQAFWKDPLWTLLSRMRILPRCAQSLQQLKRQHLSAAASSLLDHHHHHTTTTICIAHILSHVAERSVGAATAIAQHATLLPDVLGLLWTGVTTTTTCGWTLVHTLLRQSRYTAEILAPRILPRILEQCASSSSSTTAAATDALVAWRILFRYRWTASTNEDDPNKTKVEGKEEEPEEDSALEEALQDSRVLLTLATPHLAETIASTKAADWYAVLAVVPGDVWAFSPAQQKQAWQQWRAALGQLDVGGNGCWRLLAAVLQYVRAALQFRRSNKTDEVVLDRDALKELLQLTIDSPAVQQCVRCLVPFVAVADCECMVSPDTTMEIRAEASACAAIGTLLEILDQNYKELIFDDLRDAAAGCIRSALQQEPVGSSNNQNSESRTPEQVCWRNRLAGTALLFLWRTTEASESREGAATHRLREVSFILAGKLQEGDESTLAHLLTPGRMIVSTQATVSAVLQHQLERSSSPAHAQLQHSRKLWGGFGTEKEPLLCLLSRRSEGPKHKMPFESLLPLGQYWPWQMLAGDFGTCENPDDGELNPTSSTVLESTLTLIRGLEDNSDLYARSLDTGPKLYYLANLCLIGPSGSVPGLVSYCALVDNLLDRYIPLFSGTSQGQFAGTCRTHFAATESESNKPTAGEDEEEEKIKAILQQSLPSEIERPLEMFINDLFTAHERGGVDSDIFTRFLRLFLCHKIPTKARCQVVQHFRNSIHLLSIPEESPASRNAWYRHMLLGGLPSVDGSLKDAPDLLDCLASVYHSAPGGMQRIDDQFVFNWARMLFARSLAIAKQSQSGIQLACARVLKLSPVLQLAVMSALVAFLESNQSLEDLLSSVNTKRDHKGEPSSALLADGVSLTAFLQSPSSNGSQWPS